MVKVKAGVNEFGRTDAWAAFNSDKVDIVTINDPFIDLNYVVYMFQYDSTHSNSMALSRLRTGSLPSVAHHHHLPGARSLQNQFVVESTGVFTTMVKVGTDLQGGAKRVIISAPSSDAPMFVMDMNHEKYDNSLKIFSNAFCTIKCVTPQPRRLWIAPPGNWCDSHGALQNTIPASTGTAKAVGKVIPELNGKLTGMAFCVPTANVVGAGIALNDHFVKLISWYDNEFGHSNRVVDLMAHRAPRSETP
ncbi:LOW QUALITY PROTEIN: Glyceraldehyde-3-phosphate dehydrogenase [Plecturocebus cupreus]